MEFNLKYNSSFELTLESSADASEINTIFDEVYRHLANNSQMKGFRNKKIPISVVKTNFANRAKSMVANLLVQKACDYTKKQPLKFIELADDLSSLKTYPNESKPYKFSLKFSVQPMPKINSTLTGMKLDIPNISTTQDKIDWHLSLYQRADNEKQVVENRAAEEFDMLICEIKVEVDKIPCEVLSKNPGIIHLSRKNPEITDVLKGIKQGETRTFDIEPNDKNPYMIDKVKKTYFVRVYKIVEFHKAPLDNNLAKKFNHNSIDDLKNFIKSTIEYESSLETRNALEKQIIETLLKEQKAELAKASINEQKDLLKKDLSNEMLMLGWPTSKVDQKLNELDSDLEKESLEKCSLELIISQVIAELNIIPTSQDIENKIKAISSTESKPESEIRKRFSTKQGSTYLNYIISKDKVFDHIINNATFNKNKESNATN